MKELMAEKKTECQTCNRTKAVQDSIIHKHDIGPDFVGSGYHTPERFVPLLAKFSHPANATQRAQLFNQLQRHHGNRYVQRVVSAYRSQNGKEDEHKLASETLSRKGSGRPLEPGNLRVQRLFKSGVIQAKLKIGQPNDIYEHEADKVAGQVMRMPEPQVQRRTEEEEEELIQTKPLANQITPLLQRQVEEEEEEEPVMTKSMLESTPPIRNDLSYRLSQSKGGGQPLLEADRNFMERRFGVDFSGVRVHTDSNAVQMSRELNAQAFTIGRDIYFGVGRYSPGTLFGKRLLAHELTHVMQQTHGLDATDSPAASIRQSRGFYIAPLECRNRSNCSTSNNRNNCLPIRCGVGGSGICRWGGIGPKCCCYGSLAIERATSTCTPAAGIPPTNCSVYIRNSWWLPMAYVNNSTCACQVTPNSPTANCVRKFLQDRLAATPGWLKALAFEQKVNDNPANPQQYAAYQAFVQTGLGQKLKRNL